MIQKGSVKMSATEMSILLSIGMQLLLTVLFMIIRVDYILRPLNSRSAVIYRGRLGQKSPLD